MGDFDAAVEILRLRLTGVTGVTDVTGVTGVTASTEVPLVAAERSESETATAEGLEERRKEE